MVMVATGIGPAFWVERRLDGVRVPAELVHHVGDHVVGADADAVVQQLHRQVAVAEMPGDAHQLSRAVSVDFEQRFGFRDDADDAAVVELQAVAVAETDGLGEVEEDVFAGLGGEGDPAPVTAVEVDEDGVGRRTVPATGGR